ncbi:MAG TPA: ATP-dependent DNA helicase RecG [Pyrinomonadaceae bacterium]|jgi:ATP-dependent DNA helicase RecG|nr:ATP-dependent DNA helicase RecG [Pyrinomonadaceae bacterium]
MIAPMPGAISLDTPIEDLHSFKIARLGQILSRKLAKALASQTHKKSSAAVTVEDLLTYFPMRYEDRSRPALIKDLKEGVEASLELSVTHAHGYAVRNPRGYGRPQLYIFEVAGIDGPMTGREVIVWWFVSGRRAYDIVKYYTAKLARGTRFITFGRWEWEARRNTYKLRLNNAADELEILLPTEETEAQPEPDPDQTEENLPDPSLAAIHVGRRVPVYRKLGEFNSKRVREIVHAVLALLSDKEIEETLPADLRHRARLVSRPQALREIHFPPPDVSMMDYEISRSQAHVRMIFEDFFWVAFAIGLKRGQRVKEIKDAPVQIDKRVKDRIASVMPFKLTRAQRKVTAQIFNDMQSTAPMNRLLQGDVGSGKTIVAVVAMIAAMENDLQTALMAPTEILAEQHARSIKRLLARTPYRIELLTGSLRAAEKRRLQAALKEGEIHACVGTQALIQEAVAFAKLGLVVIDEQHRFGVMQRAELRARGLNPDVLVMTATPIPRSLAMTVYGDLDVSIIDELPPGRTPIETMVFGEDQRQEVKRLISREVKAGRQVYVVYPLVEESEKMDLKDATRRYEYLRDTVFPKLSVGLLHGKMKPAEKEKVMSAFVAGEIKILVSTTVIEVGVDVPNASLMVVEHAERFGLSQLHQLRGRVGRGAEKSYCILLTSDKRTAVAEERLGIMAQTSNGFVIAEKDLELRGPGELLGTKQSGLPEFRIGNIVRDQPFLEKAREEAQFYLAKEKSVVTAKMIARIKQDPRFGLAAVG